MKRISITKEGKIKLILSFSLLIYSVIVSAITKEHDIFSAMIFSFFGDIFMLRNGLAFGNVKDESDFPFGVIMFALAHVVYLIIMQTNTPWHIIVTVIQWLLVIAIFISYIITTWYQKKRYIICIPYAICILIATINAWMFNVASGIGYTLFVISDLIIVIFKDNRPKWANFAVWGTYVPAQVLILTSFLLV